MVHKHKPAPFQLSIIFFFMNMVVVELGNLTKQTNKYIHPWGIISPVHDLGAGSSELSTILSLRKRTTLTSTLIFQQLATVQLYIATFFLDIILTQIFIVDKIEWENKRSQLTKIQLIPAFV